MAAQDFEVYSIEANLDKSSIHKSVVERYYTPRYKIDIKKKPCEDQCILTHSNKICLITLAKTHPIISNQKKVEKINFQVSEDVNRLENKVMGKGKKGGQWLTELAPLCTVTCSDTSEYTLYSCVRGTLIEVNENLVENPALLTEKTQGEGYLAIVIPKLGEYKTQIGKLLTQEQYEEALEKRKKKLEQIETAVS